MTKTLLVILCLSIGLIVGGGITFLITILINKGKENKAKKMIENARREADKAKRDGILELKEESY